MSTGWEDVSFHGSPLRTQMTFDEADDKVVFRSCQPNIQDCLEMNQAFLNADRASSSLWAGRNWVRVGSIPMWLLEKWRLEDGIDFYRWNDEDKAKIVRRLNSNEYEKLRTAPGRI